MPELYETRLQKCRAEMRALGIGCLILTPGAAMRYMSGFSEEGYERLLCLIVALQRPPLFITPALNAAQAARNPAGYGDIRPWSDTDGYDDLLQSALKESAAAGPVAVDDSMPARFLLRIVDSRPAGSVISAGPLFARLRSVKDDGEIGCLRRAADLTDKAFLAALAQCKAGATEAQLARVIHDAITSAGGEPAFETIVAVGPNSALPHHHTGGKAILDGDLVLFDLGAKVDGYCGDITRVACAGKPGERQQYVYRIVYAAQQSATQRVRPGIPAQWVDAAARLRIEDYGFGKEFIHRTGHGIGLDDHEEPNIVAGNAALLETGNCFSIEPGIYLSGEFGVRLENIVVVTDDGCDVLNAPIAPSLMSAEDLLGYYGK